jgi:hypothetical protein
MPSFKAILPKRKSAGDIQRQLLAGMQAIARDVRVDFGRTTRSWSESVNWTVQTQGRGNDIVFKVFTTNQIYNWVNDGTGEAGGNRSGWYPIAPRNKKALSFPGSFTSKTVPGSLDARSGGKFGNIRVEPYVTHPGIKPRKFDETVKKKWEPLLKVRMESVMRSIAQQLR